MSTVKTEGFKIPGTSSMRPSLHRPFSDGSMAIETDLLASIDQSNNGVPMTSPFNYPTSLPNQPSLDHFMSAAAHSQSLEMSNNHQHGNAFHPAALFSNFKFSHDNPEPPISFATAGAEFDQRSRSESSSRSYHNGIGKAPSSRSRQPRKLSMNEGRPPSAGIQARGRTGQPHPRTMSHGDAFAGGRLGLAIGLDTHKEGEKTDSVSPPEFNINGTYGVPIPRGLEGTSWTSQGSAPSLIPGSFGSYNGLHDEAILDSPMTPAQPLPNSLPTNEDTFKKQRRRECHNQVEKRRREHINAKIEELSHLLPPHYNEPEEAVEDEEDEEHADGSPAKKKKSKRSNSTAKQQRDAAQCKGRILSQSVQYIYDLRHVNEMQAARIQYLESILLSSGLGAMQVPDNSNPAPFLWSSGVMNSTGNPVSHGVAEEPQLAPLAEHHQLEIMRPSPEPESFSAPWHMSQGPAGDHGGMMTFEPSPTDLSSGSVNNFRRSSSLSTSDSLQGDKKPIFGLEDRLPSPNREFASPILEEMRAQLGDSHMRKGSDVELQTSMSGMDLDAMFAGVRREDEMRW